MNLGKVTLEHAIEIIKAGYPAFFVREVKWELHDESENIGEPTMKLISPKKVYFFWFNHDDIDIVDEEKDLGLESNNYDVKYKCYVKAAELGYYVEGITELING